MPVQVNLMEARSLGVWGFPWQSNPYCRLSLGSQVMRSRKDDATSRRGSHKAPFWNQEFHFLVTDTTTQVRHVYKSVYKIRNIIQIMYINSSVLYIA